MAYTALFMDGLVNIGPAVPGGTFFLTRIWGDFSDWADVFEPG